MCCIFKKITDWQRKDFDPPNPEDAENRKTAETETFRDLSKDIQQLLCDTHEEAQRGSSVGVNKRLVALLTITAYEARRTSQWMIFLTIIILILTGFLVFREFYGKETVGESQHQNATQSSQPADAR